MTCPHCVDAGDWFGDRVADRDLKRYRKRGPSKTTRMLRDALAAEGVAGRDLLDIGGGVGALQHELLARGVTRAVSADASAAYQRRAADEAERRGTSDRVEFHHGDFVDLADHLEPAGVVTLDRVICCYPAMEALVGRSADLAEELWGAVFPRERWTLRVLSRLVNLFLRVAGRAFRVFLHPTSGVTRELERRGFEPRFREHTFLWQVHVWARVGNGRATSAPGNP